MRRRAKLRYAWIAGLAVLLVAAMAPGSLAATASRDVRVTTHDLITTDPFGSATPPTDVLQQNEPSIAVHPANANIIAVGVNDVRTLGISDDAWQGLAVSTNGGASFAFETLIPGSQATPRPPGWPRRSAATPLPPTPGSALMPPATSILRSSPFSAPRRVGRAARWPTPWRSPSTTSAPPAR